MGSIGKSIEKHGIYGGKGGTSRGTEQIRATQKASVLEIQNMLRHFPRKMNTMSVDSPLEWPLKLLNA